METTVTNYNTTKTAQPPIGGGGHAPIRSVSFPKLAGDEIGDLAVFHEPRRQHVRELVEARRAVRTLFFLIDFIELIDDRDGVAKLFVVEHRGQRLVEHPDDVSIGVRLVVLLNPHHEVLFVQAKGLQIAVHVVFATRTAAEMDAVEAVVQCEDVHDHARTAFRRAFLHTTVALQGYVECGRTQFHPNLLAYQRRRLRELIRQHHVVPDVLAVVDEVVDPLVVVLCQLLRLPSAIDDHRQHLWRHISISISISQRLGAVAVVLPWRSR